MFIYLSQSIFIYICVYVNFVSLFHQPPTISLCLSISPLPLDNLECNNLYIYYHVALSARIALTLSRHPSLSSIASGRSSRLHPVSTLAVIYRF